ncbi:MAG: nucleotidyltransferase family protein [Blautia sp.]|nr:nucleotidyltransferase family protein [Blautia sp.]
MKAFLLAAGFGTRLRPITDTIPKCLVTIKDKPLLEWWFELFRKHGIDEVLVNTHYMADQVEAFVNGYTAVHRDIKVTLFYEKELLGSGGTVNANRDFIETGEDFLICYADNLTDVNLQELINVHRGNGSVLTMALFHTTMPEQCGIAAVDKNGLITEFVEKPESPEGNLANAGIYVANQMLYQYFENDGFCDFGRDVLPRLVGIMYGYEIHAWLRDIGTLQNLQSAREEWAYDHL